MRKNISAILISVSMLAGMAGGQTGHGTHTPGTIGAVGNNAVGIGGNGRDILVGGRGVDSARPVPTGTVQFVDGVSIVVAGIQTLMTIR